MDTKSPDEAQDPVDFDTLLCESSGRNRLSQSFTGGMDLSFQEENVSVQIKFEFKILCVKGIDAPDGTEYKVTWVRGSQKIDSGKKLLKDGRVYFQQKFAMKTSIQRDPKTSLYQRKETFLRVM